MFDPFAIAQTLTFLGVVIGITLIVKFLTDKTHGVEECYRPYNPAYGLRVTSAMVAATLALSGALNGVTSETYLAYLITLVRDGVVISFVLMVVQAINEWLIVTGVDNSKAICERNMSVAITEVGGNVAAGILAYGAFHGGINGQLIPALVFLALGLGVLVFTFHAFDYFHPADLLGGVRKGDLPSGIVSAAILISISLVLKTAIAGEFVSWGASLYGFFGAAILGLGLLTVVHWLYCKYIWFLPPMGYETEDVTHALIASGSLLTTATILSLRF